ncbi:DUF6980 family protein [Paenibacillus sp. CN-4]|uniref:DUF6980 family protein n=1 Tax=Paenibacillus nanchangensis TaxID=3348343 RepID=UPI003979165B
MKVVIELEKFYYEQMTDRIHHKCEQHDDPFECPDNVIYYSPRFDEYGLIVHDGGSSYILIEFCPWCGCKLPASKRDLWFDTLDELGFDDPFEQDIPQRFKSDEWYRVN